MSILDFSSDLPMDYRAANIMMAADTFLKACGRVRLTLASGSPTCVEGHVQNVSLDGTMTVFTDEGETFTCATNQVTNVLVLVETP